MALETSHCALVHAVARSRSARSPRRTLVKPKKLQAREFFVCGNMVRLESSRFEQREGRMQRVEVLHRSLPGRWSTRVVLFQTDSELGNQNLF